MLRPRVGHIQFINCLPLYYGLVQNNVLLDVELVKGTPTELNKWLLEGKLDISPISSIEYCRNYKDLMLMPNLAVAADGEVKSILFISKVPIEEMDGRLVALSNTSATSQALTRIILRDKYGLAPKYFMIFPSAWANARSCFPSRTQRATSRTAHWRLMTGRGSWTSMAAAPRRHRQAPSAAA